MHTEKIADIFKSDNYRACIQQRPDIPNKIRTLRSNSHETDSAIAHTITIQSSSYNPPPHPPPLPPPPPPHLEGIGMFLAARALHGEVGLPLLRLVGSVIAAKVVVVVVPTPESPHWLFRRAAL